MNIANCLSNAQVWVIFLSGYILDACMCVSVEVKLIYMHEVAAKLIPCRNFMTETRFKNDFVYILVYLYNYLI